MLYELQDAPAAWREARARMLDLLECYLGSKWPRQMWRRHRSGPLPIFEAASNNLACVRLLELALRLGLCEEHPGFSDLQKALRREPTTEAGAHVGLQLEVASLTSAVAVTTPAFEQLQATGRPADVLLAFPDRSKIAVETCTLFTDEAWRLASADNHRVSQRIVMAGIRNEVSWQSEISEQMSSEETDDWLNRGEDAARDVAAGGVPRVICASSARAVVRPRESGEQGRIFKGPRIESVSWPRILRRIVRKAAQTESDTETWIRLDLLDGTWQFTPWSTAPLSAKIAALEGTIAETFPEPPRHLGGIVVSNGAGYGASELRDESHTTTSGATALRRRLWPLRVRETLILPIGASARPSGELFRQAYSAEPGWLDNALLDVGLEPLGSLWRAEQATDHDG